ncbi:MAG TPA: isoprenylcysteine carboxylmethyltransferase family protein [Anaerolineales bacterium]|nr:isoprenylcysteine carboxylmethyltransferase family protein [Anaerolineales bacterium]HNQ95609.1 isoprenylcysteine carboxylmethyltransferase family protein [Anaerolineales bacterium]HNS59612.1 isoprenylcysteine carboxylmethyltransferase family protein [Anaerolineales bacterium]
MFMIYWIIAGSIAMAVGAILLGIWLRRNPSKENAEKSSRIMHFLFFAGQVAPPLVALFYPGISRLDDLVSLQPLPMRPVFLGIGILLAIPGFYFMAATNKLLRAIGKGTNAFVLTKHVVNDDIYKRTRNPMSLGFYLLAIALGFVTGSTFATLAAVLGIIPSHLIFIKYFEEKELELRFGESYLEYKKNVPFLFPKFGK